MSLRPDLRASLDESEKRCRCRRCGTQIVLLPDDRRQGFCFDCYDPLELTSDLHISGPKVTMRCNIGR
ncbi:MAG: hypothetical protein AB1665_07635 [Candidatus Thermoplasmatota archaeon]